MLTKLQGYYSEINKLSDEIPEHVTKKIMLYSHALLIIGRFQAQAINEYGNAYAERKAEYGRAIVETEGTGPVKEAWGEIRVLQLRKQEAQAESEVKRWENAFKATTEIINALKVHLKTLMHERDIS